MTCFDQTDKSTPTKNDQNVWNRGGADACKGQHTYATCNQRRLLLPEEATACPQSQPAPWSNPRSALGLSRALELLRSSDDKSSKQGRPLCHHVWWTIDSRLQAHLTKAESWSAETQCNYQLHRPTLFRSSWAGLRHLEMYELDWGSQS